MHKIKKGIKKKIKGKKGKHDDDEIFTEEELEQYKREKAEEARKLAEEQQQNHQEHPLDESAEAEAYYENNEHHTVDKSNSGSPPVSSNSDWKSFLATTDTVLKKTSDNLEHIKESSYFQAKKEESHDIFSLNRDVLVEPLSQKNSRCVSPVQPAPAQNWVDLDKGFDDESEGEEGDQNKEEIVKPESPSKKKFVELKPIEDLPELSAEDYADVFDTAYVDNVESGDLKLIIPDSPVDEYLNEPDPFDTSAADRVLHVEEPEVEKEEEKPVTTAQNAKDANVPKKRKIQLVSLGNAVDVLTGKTVQEKPKPKTDEADEINLLGDFSDTKKDTTSDSAEENVVEDKSDDEVAKDHSLKTEEVEEPEENLDEEKETDDKVQQSEIDNLLFTVDENLDNLPQLGIPDLTKAPSNTESDKEDDIDILNIGVEDNTKKNKESVDLKDIVSEFDIIDTVESNDETLIVEPKEDQILDEFDAEFASLAHESVAKAKDKEIEEIGLEADEDDPFDTSHINVQNENLDTNVIENGAKATESECIDPFDTSVADHVIPTDNFESIVNEVDPSTTLEPSTTKNSLVHSESFDPFDTSAADAFGITELKALESELLTEEEKLQASGLKSSDSDFDFNPREDEEKPCLLTTEAEIKDENVLQPQGPVEDDIDPFDTSIADKIQIQTLEEELLTKSIENTDITSSDIILPQEPEIEEEIDPFDTSIADKIQIQSLEEELINKTNNNCDTLFGAEEKPKRSTKPPRPVSPACLLATSPTTDDINPTLQPQTFTDTDANDIDPFDTSVADAYGKTELKVLESELIGDIVRPNNFAEAVDESNIKEPVQKEQLTIDLKPPRPPSPACLLGATPVDENPTLVPVSNLSEQDAPEDDFDPFDTSIAAQFGKTELHVLESELLASPAKSDNEDFNPRGTAVAINELDQEQNISKPAEIIECLLSSIADEAITSIPLAPAESSDAAAEEDFDPFDTSIADKFGNTELKHLEDVLLDKTDNEPTISNFTNRPSTLITETSLTASSTPERPPPAQHCLLATTPTDQSQPLKPISQGANSSITAEVDDFDPFDTSIANQFGRTEIKELEDTLLSTIEPALESQSINSIAIPASITDTSDPFDTSIADQVQTINAPTTTTDFSDDDFDPRGDGKISTTIKTNIDLLDSGNDSHISDTSAPVLQPQETLTEADDEVDPFDTSIAASILPGKTELKLLETELLN